MDNDTVAVDGEARLAADSASSQGKRNYGTQSGYKAAMTVNGVPVEAETSESSSLLRDSRQSSPDAGDSGRQHSPPTWPGEFDFEGLPWWRRPSVFWLILPLIIFAATFGGTVVPTINLVKELFCRAKFQRPIDADDEVCNLDTEIQSKLAMFMLYMQVIGGLLSAITCPKLGAMSDRYGRLKILAIASIGSLVKDLFIIFITKNSETVSVYWYLIAYAIDGLTGSFTAAMAVVHAYASDCTPPSKRATVFGWFYSCFFTGIAFGPILAGYIIEWTGGILNLFYIALGCHVLFLSSVLFVVPESLTKERQLLAREKKLKADARAREARLASFQAATSGNALGFFSKGALSISLWWQEHSIFAPLHILFPTGPGTSWALRQNMLLLAAVDTISFATAMGAMTVVIIYLGHVFNWSNLETSQFLSVFNISRVTCLLLVLPIITRMVRGRPDVVKQREDGCDTLDLALIRVSVAFDAIGYAGFALAPTGGWMTAAGVVASIGGMGSPTLQSSLTKHVPPDVVGQLLGAMGLLHALARVVAPTVFNFIYARTVVVDMPAVIFVVLACLFCIAFILSWGIRSGVYLDAKAASRLQGLEPEQDDGSRGRERTANGGGDREDNALLQEEREEEDFI